MSTQPQRNLFKRVIFIMILIPSLAYSQEIDSVATDSLMLAVDSLQTDSLEKEPPPYYLGIYFDGGISIEPSASDHNLMSSIGGGVQYQKWAVGFTVYDFQGSFESFVIFPNVFDLRYRYGGPNVGYYFLMNRNINLSASISYLRGDMVWRDKEDGQDFFRDEFNMIKANLKMELGRFRYAKPYVGVGYQMIRDLELAGIKEEDFTGVNYFIGIRVGFFNQ